MARKPSLITLLTDFGTADYFVGAMKGVILAINPTAHIVDITHEVPPQDIASAAFTLLAAYQSFPVNTIHVAVVDPGVGSTRRPILVSAAKQFFIGPDNGVFSYILDVHPSHKVFHLTNEKYFRRPVSPSFHGRDLFAPCAAALSKGVSPTRLGKRIKGPLRLPGLKPERINEAEVSGRIIHIDHFGNCVTNITRADLSEDHQNEATLVINGRQISSFRKFFADEDSGDALFMIWGSAGFLEIASRNRSAAGIIKVQRGEAIVLRYQK